MNGAPLGINQPDGITMIDPQLELGASNIFRPKSSSPLIGVGSLNYDFIIEDIDGQSRSGSIDIGADQISNEPIVNKPLRPNDNIGTYWMKKLSSIEVNSNGNGRVDIYPLNYFYLQGTIVTLTAVPDSGFVFEKWTGDETSNQNPISIVMEKNKKITAHFIELKIEVKYTLSFWIIGAGSLNITPLNSSYEPGTEITITAVPEAGWKFSSWGNDLSGSANPEKIIMNKNKSVIVTFEQITSVNFEKIPQFFEVYPNYPNPFNPSTEISFAFPQSSSAIVKIYDMLGKEVRVLTNSELSAGVHKLTWDSRNNSGELCAAGLYIINIHTSFGTKSIKAMLMK